VESQSSVARAAADLDQSLTALAKEARTPGEAPVPPTLFPKKVTADANQAGRPREVLQALQADARKREQIQEEVRPSVTAPARSVETPAIKVDPTQQRRGAETTVNREASVAKKKAPASQDSIATPDVPVQLTANDQGQKPISAPVSSTSPGQGSSIFDQLNNKQPGDSHEEAGGLFWPPVDKPASGTEEPLFWSVKTEGFKLPQVVNEKVEGSREAKAPSEPHDVAPTVAAKMPPEIEVPHEIMPGVWTKSAPEIELRHESVPAIQAKTAHEIELPQEITPPDQAEPVRKTELSNEIISTHWPEVEAPYGGMQPEEFVPTEPQQSEVIYKAEIPKGFVPAQRHQTEPVYESYAPEEFAPAAQYQAGPIRCIGCLANMEPGSKFCGECGTMVGAGAQIPACHLCGSPMDPLAKFCGECGSKQIAPIQPIPAVSAAVAPNGANQPFGNGNQPAAPIPPTQRGWVVKLLKYLET
jgi:hypothetical protein